jgi:molybdenum cofactor cytidylyltransferase
MEHERSRYAHEVHHMSPTRSVPTVVVLAAGGGTRFDGDGPKLGQRLGAASVLGHTLGAVVSAGLPLVVVTVAALVDAARSVVASRDIVLLPPVGSASREPLGVGFSIAAGVGARPHVPGWLILPGDMPLVQPQTLRQVARALDTAPVAYAQHARGFRSGSRPSCTPSWSCSVAMPGCAGCWCAIRPTRSR